jgi:hypothetical protein
MIVNVRIAKTAVLALASEAWEPITMQGHRIADPGEGFDFRRFGFTHFCWADFSTLRSLNYYYRMHKPRSTRWYHQCSYFSNDPPLRLKKSLTIDWTTSIADSPTDALTHNATPITTHTRRGATAQLVLDAPRSFRFRKCSLIIKINYFIRLVLWAHNWKVVAR